MLPSAFHSFNALPSPGDAWRHLRRRSAAEAGCVVCVGGGMGGCRSSWLSPIGAGYVERNVIEVSRLSAV